MRVRVCACARAGCSRTGMSARHARGVHRVSQACQGQPGAPTSTSTHLDACLWHTRTIIVACPSSRESPRGESREPQPSDTCLGLHTCSPVMCCWRAALVSHTMVARALRSPRGPGVSRGPTAHAHHCALLCRAVGRCRALRHGGAGALHAAISLPGRGGALAAPGAPCMAMPTLAIDLAMAHIAPPLMWPTRAS